MPRTCTVCSHRERAAINRALVERFMRDFIRQTLIAEGTIDEADLELWRLATTADEAGAAGS